MTKLTLLPGAPNEIIMQREFAAPRRLVVQAMTTPALIKRWLGGVRAEVTSVELDLRVGGSYRYVFRLPDGGGFSFSGVYREGDERIVYTQRFNDEPGDALVTTTWTEVNGTTTMRVVVAFDSPALRDQVFGTGMADGAGESYDKLEELIASL